MHPSAYIASVVFALILIILALTAALILSVVIRRYYRDRYFRIIDRSMARYGPLISSMLAGTMDYTQGLQELRDIPRRDCNSVFERFLAENVPKPAELTVLRRLCEDLGLVELWQQNLAGRFRRLSPREVLSDPVALLMRLRPLRFLLRAKSAENLGIIRDKASLPLLIKALDDPHPDVQAVAARSVAAIAGSESFAALAERIQNDVSRGSTSRFCSHDHLSALATLPLSLSIGLLPLLSHDDSQVRYLATDIIREMVQRQVALDGDHLLKPEVFAPQLAESFLTRLAYDENANVRARAGPVIAHLDDRRAIPTLLKLLDDPEWFVRLHAVRALSQRHGLSHFAPLRARLSDSQWMVREAAVRALLACGRPGREALLDHFLSTTDRYSREQIAEEMQRTGLIRNLLEDYATSIHSKEAHVVELLAEMGKTSNLVAMLPDGPDLAPRQNVLRDLILHSNSKLRALGTHLATEEAERKSGSTSRALGDTLRPDGEHS